MSFMSQLLTGHTCLLPSHTPRALCTVCKLRAGDTYMMDDAWQFTSAGVRVNKHN
jgi:hypothetical protein